MSDKATAPYNFVSLPQQVLKSPIEGKAESDPERCENYRQHVLQKGNLNGSIEFSIKTMTPVFVGNGGSEFFSPNGTPVISGSTIRGMVKNIFKIVTCSAMRGDNNDADFNDKHLYFRSMAGIKTIRQAYTKRMTSFDPVAKKNKSKAQAGFLIHNQTDLQYYMVPTNFKEMDGNQYEVNDKSPGIEWNSPGKGQVTTYTGKMNGKHYYTEHLKPDDWHSRDLVDAAVIQSYKDDTTRKGISIFDSPYCKKNAVAAEFVDDDEIDFVAPCFFVREHHGIEHFGFGRYYRIPYQLSIGDHVPESLKTNVVDYTDAIFGRKELWGSRVFFEDACCDSNSDAQEKPAYSRVLSGPKPTSYQLYLEQQDFAPYNHWDTKGTSIRGYKFYWHKKEDWRKDAQEADKQTPHKIHPVKAGQVFHGRIRFERLSEDELGALLKVFELSAKDANLCFKLGQGKSIGMGSVRIDVNSLKIINDTCYKQLFTNELRWNPAESEEDIEQYIRKFDEVLKTHLPDKAYRQYQISQRELAHLLDWKNINQPDWNKKTQMMSIEDKNKPFQHRWVLPTASEVE